MCRLRLPRGAPRKVAHESTVLSRSRGQRQPNFQLPGSRLERSRWRGGRWRVGRAQVRGSCPQMNCGSQGGPCDPSTQNHAGRTPASSLLGGYYTTLHPVRRKVRATLRLFSGPPGSAAHSGVPGPNSSRCRSCRPARVTNHLCALRFFYVQTLEKPWSIADTPYPKKTDAVGSESS